MSKSRKSAGAANRSSRRALPLLIVLFAAGAAGGVWYANRQSDSGGGGRDTVDITHPSQQGNDVGNKRVEVPIDPKKDALKQALEAQLAPPKSGAASAFPAGTKLVSLDVRDGTAILELSPEFNRLNTMGDTGESLAYDALRKVLAQFAHVQRMRVMVEGKVFEGEHRGPWAEVPVRDDHARVEDIP